MPLVGPRRPNQRTSVPLKVKVAWAPAAAATAAVPPLQAGLLVSPWVHGPL